MLATLPSPVSTEATRIERAVRQALARHETALGRLRYELPNPSEATLAELEAAESSLRQTQAARDAFGSRRGRAGLIRGPS